MMIFCEEFLAEPSSRDIERINGWCERDEQDGDVRKVCDHSRQAVSREAGDSRGQEIGGKTQGFDDGSWASQEN